MRKSFRHIGSLVSLYIVSMLVLNTTPVFAAIEAYNFNSGTINDFLADDFEQSTNPDAYLLGNSDGIEGSNYIDTAQRSNIWTTRTAQRVNEPGSGEYIVSGYFYNAGNSGYGALGITATSKPNLDETNPPRTNTGIGVAVHGGGGHVYNAGAEIEAPSWTGGDLTNGWWYMELVVSPSDNIFNVTFNIYPSDEDGTLGAIKTTHSYNNLTNVTLDSADNARAYFGTVSTDAGRFARVDNFSFEGDEAITPEPFDYGALFEDGDGTEETPYRIADCEQLQNINQVLDAYFVLANDIDCSVTTDWNDGEGFLPIGDYSNPFTGELDGDYHKITNLFIDTTVGDGGSAGVFRRIGNSDNQVGLVKDLGLEDADITGEWSTGGLVGVLYGQVNNTYTTGTVTGGGEVGGLVGSHGGVWDTVIDSWSSATVTGDSDGVGGLVGYNAEDSQITNSYASGDVHGGDDDTGGLVGINYGDIENSHATGNVSADDDRAGGLAGINEGSIYRAYASGFVTGNNSIGGLVGENSNGEINRSYSNNANGGENNTGVNGSCDVGGLVGYNSSDDWVTNNFSRSSVWVSEVCGAGGLIGNHNDGAISQTYATGAANSADSNYEGGLIGNSNSSSVWSSFWDVQTSGLSDGCGLSSAGDCVGAEKVNGKTTAQMKTEAIYTDADVLAEGVWDFEDIWEINPEVNDGYPFFINTTGATPTEWVDTDPEDEQDLNGDDIPDSEQPNIGGYTSSYTDKLVAIDVGEDCELTTDDMTSESDLAVQDSEFDYINGLWEWEADCETETTTVKLYYYGVSSEDLVARKFSTITNTYFTLEDATFEDVTINNQSVAVITYQVTDNSDRDMNPDVGTIQDPAGPGERLSNSSSLADTGQNATTLMVFASTACAVAALALAYQLAKRRQGDNG